MVPCAILAVLIYPYTSHATIYRILWAFCVYLEAISVLPQLRMIQNAKVLSNLIRLLLYAVTPHIINELLSSQRVSDD